MQRFRTSWLLAMKFASHLKYIRLHVYRFRTLQDSFVENRILQNAKFLPKSYERFLVLKNPLL